MKHFLRVFLAIGVVLLCSTGAGYAAGYGAGGAAYTIVNQSDFPVGGNNSYLVVKGSDNQYYVPVPVIAAKTTSQVGGSLACTSTNCSLSSASLTVMTHAGLQGGCFTPDKTYQNGVWIMITGTIAPDGSMSCTYSVMPS